MSGRLGTRPVGPDEIDALARLFDTSRTTRHCSCMAFCSTRRDFASGWLFGGNRRRFESMASGDPTPMGILAERADEPVGWCACGPQSRYAAAPSSGRAVVSSRKPFPDERVWLLPCVYVRAGHRGQGVTHALVSAAVALAERQGATAIEGWPLAATAGRSADAFVGRQQVFEDAGFRCVERPAPQRVIMRRELTARDGTAPAAGSGWR